MAILAEDARTLMTATADAAGKKVGEARKRLAASLERGKEFYGQVCEKAVAGAKAADEAVREHPYQTIVIALGSGRFSATLSHADVPAVVIEPTVELLSRGARHIPFTLQ